jgi:hypothetical protein
VAKRRAEQREYAAQNGWERCSLAPPMARARRTIAGRGRGGSSGRLASIGAAAEKANAKAWLPGADRGDSTCTAGGQSPFRHLREPKTTQAVPAAIDATVMAAVAVSIKPKLK